MNQAQLDKSFEQMVNLINYSIEPLFTIEETAFLLGVTETAAGAWIDRGMMPVVEVQGRNFIRQSDIGYVMKHGRTPNSDRRLYMTTPKNFEPNRKRKRSGRVAPVRKKPLK